MVKIGTHKATGATVAIKSVAKRRPVYVTMLREEVKILTVRGAPPLPRPDTRAHLPRSPPPLPSPPAHACARGPVSQGRSLGAGDYPVIQTA